VGPRGASAAVWPFVGPIWPFVGPTWRGTPSGAEGICMCPTSFGGQKQPIILLRQAPAPCCLFVRGRVCVYRL
jgi:hypothetical protein